jgi:hypothetical protein
MKTLEQIQQEKNKLYKEELNYHIKKLKTANYQANLLYKQQISKKS